MGLGVFGIVLSLVFLITAAYRGMSVIIAAPLAAVIALLFNGVSLLPAYTEIFMPGAASFIVSYFPLFLTGAIFGQLMSASGYAIEIAQTITRFIGPKRTILGAVITGALLTYGGISVFVVVFVMFPLSLELFRQADIPRRLIPAAIALGCFTFVMTSIPGSPQIQNIIPGQFFGTTVFAAPVLGIVSGVLMFGLGMIYLEWRKKRMARAGESFASLTTLELKALKNGSSGTAPPSRAPGSDENPDTGADGAVSGTSTLATVVEETPALPLNRVRIRPFIPLVTVFVLNLVMTYVVLPDMDWDFLDTEMFGGITLQDRISVWSVLLAMLAGIGAVILLNITRLRELSEAFGRGARDSLLPIFNTSSEVGYGTVIGSLAAFIVIREAVTNLSANALLNSSVAVSVLAAITGSASGGMTIALQTLGDDLMQQAEAQGFSMEVMHRVVAMGSGGLDTMPHNGAIIAALIICGMTHRDSYKDIFVVTLVIPSLITLVMIGVITAML